ncbi:MAG TPA: adenylate/guanylate cyclase domain-containing protein [Candidatus Nitrosopolaris sp.]|nr:adenylate/guanylate cyclase domain-containing protein [Candidatus Nitrosopolaris sp.]
MAGPAGDRRPRTPPDLAEKILASRSHLEGERKQVTVLFADVKGSMELAEQVDPEAWHQILDRFFAILAAGVHRFEGTVNQFTGDGIMALFGAPIAHEDHAQRACHAALHLAAELRRYAHDLRRERGLSFSVRMGLNSGDVVVGAIGDDLRMDYTAQGHTVGLAQRMEQLAEPGRIYLTEHTARLVAGFFRLDELGQFSVKGVRAPVRVFALEGVGPLRTRLEQSRARGFSRFVGRDAETATLDAALERAQAGRGGVVDVVAEAGVGKSRLCFEFTARARARGVAVHEGHCVAHGKMVPFLPVLELLRGYFGVGEPDGDDAARRKIAGTVLLLDPELTTSLPLLFDFLGVPDPGRRVPRMDPEARQRQLFALVRRLIEVRSGREPTVILLEDLHWIDAGSEALLVALVERVAATRTLLLTTSRPEYHPAWGGTASAVDLRLVPLGREATAALLGDLLGSDPSLATLAELVRERTTGNPFFVEEIVQALVESGSLAGPKGAYRLTRPVDAIAVPATVQAVLAARIDRLPEREKEVLQAAAVIGREFAEAIVRRVSEFSGADVAAALRALERAEFIYEDTVPSDGGFAFKHPLTHEVAYRSQLAARRASMHAAVARALAEGGPDKVDERAALLAHHWEEAGEALMAARWSRRAAEWVGVNDLAAAARHWQNVRALLGRVPESLETMDMGVSTDIALLNLGWRAGMSEEEAGAIFAEGMALASRIGDAKARIGLLTTYGVVRGMSGRIAEGLECTAEGTRLADGITDVGLQLVSRIALTQAQHMSGDLNATLTTVREGLERAANAPRGGGSGTGFSPAAWLVAMEGWVLFEMGQVEAGEGKLEEALSLARDQGEDEILGWCNEFLVYVASLRGDVGRALEHARRAVEIAERLGSALSRASAYYALGCAHTAGEDWPSAVSAFEVALTIIRERRTGLHWEPLILAGLAEVHLGRGEVAPARTIAEEAARLAGRLGTRITECWAQQTLARVYLAAGRASRGAAEGALRRAFALIEETGARLYEAPVRRALAELAGGGGS